MVEEESEAAVLQELLLRSLLFAGSLVVLRSARRQLRDPLPPRCNTPTTRLCYSQVWRQQCGFLAADLLPEQRTLPPLLLLTALYALPLPLVLSLVYDLS